MQPRTNSREKGDPTSTSTSTTSATATTTTPDSTVTSLALAVIHIVHFLLQKVEKQYIGILVLRGLGKLILWVLVMLWITYTILPQVDVWVSSYVKMGAYQ